MGGDVEERLGRGAELASAIVNQELRVHYQPIVDLTTGEVVEVEALVRWQHPRLGLLPPVRFISIAEESNLIQAIGAWVLETVGRQVLEWRALGRRPGRVAINLSPRQL